MNFNIICNPSDFLNSSNLDPNRKVIPAKALEFSSQNDIVNMITLYYHISNDNNIEKLLNSFFSQMLILFQ
jgi:hypothetical protein